LSKTLFRAVAARGLFGPRFAPKQVVGQVGVASRFLGDLACSWTRPKLLKTRRLEETQKVRYGGRSAVAGFGSKEEV